MVAAGENAPAPPAQREMTVTQALRPVTPPQPRSSVVGRSGWVCGTCSTHARSPNPLYCAALSTLMGWRPCASYPERACQRGRAPGAGQAHRRDCPRSWTIGRRIMRQRFVPL